jgi:hypothetical protein
LLTVVSALEFVRTFPEAESVFLKEVSEGAAVPEEMAVDVAEGPLC